MNILLLLLRVHIPMALKKKKIKVLFEMTGNAFQCDTPVLNGLSYEGLLREYAMFAKIQSEMAIAGSGDIRQIKESLFQNALVEGARLKRKLRLKGMKDIIEASRLFYKILGINFRGNENGEIYIGRCYFSEYFTPEVCRIISSLDEGIAAGLSDGKKIYFNYRITEGRNCCYAVIK